MNSLTVRGLVLGSGLPKICVPLTPQNDRELVFELEALTETPYDLWSDPKEKDIMVNLVMNLLTM